MSKNEKNRKVRTATDDKTIHPGYSTDRSDGRYMSALGFKHAYLKTTRPKLAFDPAMTADEFPLWQQKVRTKLQELLRFPDVPPQPEPKLLWTKKRDGYSLQKWECYPEPFSVVPFLVLVPDEASQSNPLAAVLCFSGSRSTKEMLAVEPELFPDIPENRRPDKNKVALEFVRAGFVSIAVENPGAGETLERAGELGNENTIWTGRSKLSRNLLYMGRNYPGLSAFQKQTILNWVKTLDFVDCKRIAICGFSLGTEPAIALGVLDPEVGAVISNDYVCSQRNEELALAPSDDGVNIRFTLGIWHCIPDFWVWLDLNELLAAIAPRPLLALEGGQTVLINRLQRAYDLLKSGRNFQIHYMEKYATPDKRLYDNIDLPEGITQAEYLDRVNVDPSFHYFKGDIAIPWLQKTFSF